MENGITPQSEWLDFPNVNDGVRNMQFIETMFVSNQNGTNWTPWIEK